MTMNVENFVCKYVRKWYTLKKADVGGMVFTRRTHKVKVITRIFVLVKCIVYIKRFSEENW